MENFNYKEQSNIMWEHLKTDRNKAISFSISIGKEFLQLYESIIRNDLSPRYAIQSAERYLKNPCKYICALVEKTSRDSIQFSYEISMYGKRIPQQQREDAERICLMAHHIAGLSIDDFDFDRELMSDGRPKAEVDFEMIVYFASGISTFDEEKFFEKFKNTIDTERKT